MYGVSARFLKALRSSYTRINSVVHRNLLTGVTTQLAGRTGYLLDGTVTEDSTQRPRRTLSLTLANLQTVWDTLDTVGGELTVQQGIRYVDGGTEMVPMGVFVVDVDNIGYSPKGNIAITAPDRWIKVQRNRFGLSRVSVPSNEAWQEVQRLVEACWGGSFPFPGWSQLDETATIKVGQLVWDDGDRDGAIGTILTANSIECYFDRNGQAVLRPVPVWSNLSPSVWSIDATSEGVLIDANRSRDRSTARNAVIVSSSATDITLAPVEVKNTTSGDPLSVNGPLGYVPEYLSLPTLRNSTQMHNAGITELSKGLGVAQQLTLSAAPNPALDAEDVILAVLPKTDANLDRPTELHILDTVAHPLGASAQEADTRSTRPTTDGT